MKITWPSISFATKQIQSEERKAVIGLSDELAKFLTFGTKGGGTPSSAIQLYNDSTAVSIPVNRITESFASIDPVIEIDGKIVKKHPILDLLNSPSPYYDGALFLETISKDYLITGETEIVAIGSINRPPLELQPISPKNVSPIEGTGGIAARFDVTGATLAGIYLIDKRQKRTRYINGTLRELKQIRSYSTKNNALLRGQSPLVSASAEARQHILGNTHNTSLLEKGGRVSLVFHFDSDMDDDDFEAIKERVRAQYGGAKKAGEIGVTSGGKLDIKEIGTNNKDMDFAKLKSMAIQAVALQYKFPLPLIMNDSATFDNYKQAKLAMYDDAVLPLADRIFGGLTQMLMPRYGLDSSRARITYDMDDITALTLRRNEELKLRKELNIESDNELRAMIGREPYDGGNQILKPANLIPVGRDTFIDDNPTVILDDNPPNS